MTQSCWQKSPTEATLQWQGDVAIVGAGICGLSLAFWIKKLAPKLRVMVVDGQELGAGASGRNAGFNTAGSTYYLAQLIEKLGLSRAQRYWAFKQESLRLMRQELFSKSGVKYEPWGSTTLYRDSLQWEQHGEILAQVAQPECQRVSQAELRQQGLSGFCGGWRYPHEGRVHPLTLLSVLRDRLVDEGVSLQLCQQVGWGAESGQGVELQCERGVLKAQHVFLALNGYAASFHPGLAQWVSPKRAQMVALECPRELRGNYYDPAHKVYFRQAPELNHAPLLLGGMRLIDESNEDTDRDHISARIQEALQEYAQTLFSTQLRIMARWSGTMGFTSEERPYIRAVPFLKHTTFVGGFSGHGMGVAFGTAHLAISRYLALPTATDDILPC